MPLLLTPRQLYIQKQQLQSALFVTANNTNMQAIKFTLSTLAVN